MKDTPTFRLWLAALRSGELLQGRSRLVITSDTGEAKYCCLGVLAKLVDPGAVGSDGIEMGEDTDGFPLDTENEVLPTRIRATVGMRDSDEQACIRWNDDEMLSFAEIADRIEALVMEATEAQRIKQ
jgi:hypothetical protein